MKPPEYWVTLTENYRSMGEHLGHVRQDEAHRMRLRDKHGFNGDGLNVHVEGAMGEIAAAEVLGVFFKETVNSFKDADLPHVQVRTRSKHHYDLNIRPGDGTNYFYVLVTGAEGRYCVRGWIWGREAKENDAWYQDIGNARPMAWWVPQTALYDMAELKLRLAGVVP